MRKSAWDITLENQGLVGSVIKKEFMWILDKCQVMDFQDLYQIGLMGLHKSVTRYDKKRGYTLGTYAYIWIKQYIQRAYFADGFRFTRIPEHNIEKVRAIIRRLDKGETLRELFDDAEITECTYRAAKISLGEKSFVELDAPISDETTQTYGETFEMEEERSLKERLQDADMEAAVRRQLDRLGPRERYVLNKRYGFGGEEPMTLQEVGDIMGVSQERIRQIEKRAIENLKTRFRRGMIKFEEFV